MDPGKIFQIITNSTLLATRLLPGAGGPVQFSEPRYCVLLSEDAPPAVTVAKVTAVHKEGAKVRYRITGGNRDGLFTINRRSGLITLAAPLDYELHPKHELVVAAEAEGKMVHTIVQVTVADVNDNPPRFLENDLSVNIVEEDDTGLPATILKIEAQDDDLVDQGRLVYSVGGDGVDGYGARDAYFTINSHTGELIQLRALDRDPPRGRETWRVKVQVRDGQKIISSNPHQSYGSSYPSSRRRYPRVPKIRRPLFRPAPSTGQDVPEIGGLERGVHVDSDRQLETKTIESKQSDRLKANGNHLDPQKTEEDEMEAERTAEVLGKSRRTTTAEKRHKFKELRSRTSSVREMKTKSSLTAIRSNRKRDEIRLKMLRFPNIQRVFSRRTQRLSSSDSPSWKMEEEEEEEEKKEEGKEEEEKEEATSSAENDSKDDQDLRERKPIEWSSKGKHSLSVKHQQKKKKKKNHLLPSRKLLFFQNNDAGDDELLDLRLKGSPSQTPTLFHATKSLAVQIEDDVNDANQRLKSPGEEKEDIDPRRPLAEPGKNHRHSNATYPSNSPSISPLETQDRAIHFTEDAPLPSKVRFSSRQRRTFVKRYAADGGGCQDYPSDIGGTARVQTSGKGAPVTGYGGTGRGGGGMGEAEDVHVVDTIVTVTVKDINDNAPSFPNATIFGEVQENGPIDLSVGVVSAWDADDEAEGTNAQITYTIEKNVIEERSGQAIFAVHPETGLVRTAICCLDRETTPEYHIQVVAVDGGGLKGTGTVVVRLADVNDNSPRLTRELWQVEVNETWAAGPPDNKTLVEIATLDHDTSNYFFYRVVESSGWGWEHFAVRTRGTTGELYANRTLDYEDPAHRRGFRFMVQVTDRGRGGWSDSRHTDTAWVNIHLKDLNDNPPEFRRPHVHITVREDTPPGTLLATLPARDPDMSGHQKVRYRVRASWGALTVDSGGGVRLWRSLDRESPGGEKAIAKVIGVDEGVPPLTSTATLTVTVTDVNDCPPRLLPPTVLHIREGSSASRLGLLTATDDDVWALGHGPPFNLSLAPTNPRYVLELLTLKYDPTVDSGRGGAEIWTLGPIDREEHRKLTAEILLSDAGGMSTTQPVTVVVDDVNDNPMKPASKTVYLWKMQGGGVDADIGRVYVDDPDDWDLEDKTFAWAGPAHPLFTLNTNTGEVYASTQVREGRYDLHFSVSDRIWRQRNISANVTVDVRYLSPEALAHAVPVTLTPTTPAEITSGWTPKRGGGGLGLLSAAVTKVVQQAPEKVEIVSVYGPPSSKITHAVAYPVGAFPHQRVPADMAAPFACVWVSVKKERGGYIDPIKLQGLLALHIQQLEDIMKLRVLLEEPPRENGPGSNGKTHGDDIPGSSDPSSVASMASTSLSLQVVDTNSTSLVTPRLSRALDCRAHIRDADDSCTPTSCLNGGRCVRTDKGNRCICPGASWGRRCKILSRSFHGRGWAWVRPLPPCLPTTLSLRLLTTNPDGLLLYSGPLASTSPRRRQPPAPMMALQLVGGRPQVLLEGSRGSLMLEIDVFLDNGDWHTLDLHLNSQGVTLMVDQCGRGWASNITAETQCLSRAAWPDSPPGDGWISSVPLQVGGLAHPYPHPHLFGWSSTLVDQGLNGCLSHLKINTQLIDLGEPAFSSGSSAHCSLQDGVCEGRCGFQGKCSGGLREPMCDCDPGYTGVKCDIPTVPVTLGQGSFTKLTLSFVPDPYALTTQLRLRTQGRSSGLLLHMTSQLQHFTLSVRLRGGVACATEGSPAEEEAIREVCVEDYFLGDGSWHTIYVTRQGYDLSLSVDDGDGWRHNGTLAPFLGSLRAEEFQEMEVESPVPFEMEQGEELVVGGVPQYSDLNGVTVHHDLSDSCIDDVRVSGHTLPLQRSTNGSEWGQVTTSQQVDTGCLSPNLCANTSCLPPLSCHQTWRHTTCSCGPGGHLIGGICQDIDECVYQPCLHGGTCTNMYPGYQCTCNHGTTGYNCEWHHLPAHTHHLTPPMAIAALTVSLLVLVLMGVLLTIWIHRSRAGRGGALRQTGVESETDVGSVMGVIETPLSAHDSSSRASKEEMTLLESLKIRFPVKSASMEGIKQPISSISHSRVPDEPMKDASIILPVSTTSISQITRRSPSSESILTSRGKPLVGTPTSTLSSSKVMVSGMTSTQPLLAQDDLRAYAYEGDGSPSGSLTSTVLGLRRESLEENVVKPLMPEYGEVLDLLKTLPDAIGTPIPPPPEGLRCRLEGDKAFLRSRGICVTPALGGIEKSEVISRTSSQCSGVSGIGIGLSDQGHSTGTLPHSVKRPPRERKTSLTEFSTVC